MDKLKKLSIAFILLTVIIILNGCFLKKVTIEITQEDFDNEMVIAQNQYLSQGMPFPEDMEEFKQNVLDQIVQREILIAAANKAGFKTEAEEVEAEMESIRSNFPSEEEFLAILEQQGYTIESLELEISEGLAVNKFIEEKILSDLVIEDEEAIAFYDENPQYFSTPESITASHIIIKVEDFFSDAEKADARARIDVIANKLSNGEDFATLAIEFSEGPSGPSGGELGTFGRGQMVEPFEEAAFSLEVNEISEVVETRFGYHLIKVTDKIAEGMTPFEEVQESIVNFLSQEKEGELIDEFTESKKEKYEIIYPEV